MSDEGARVLGIDVDALTLEEVVAECAAAIEGKRTLQLGVINVSKLVQMQTDQFIREAVTGSDLVLADGMPVVWASRLLGRGLPERVAGIDLFVRLLEWGSDHERSVYLLGATDEVLQAVKDVIAARHPGLKVAGSRNGYFSEDEERDVVEDIRSSSPDMLFVAISSPKKELFMGRWGRELAVPVVHGVGGSFDVVAGKVKRAPESWQRLGMEWLYRLLQEPRRMWKRYLVTNSKFVYLLTRELLGFPRPLKSITPPPV